jgi:hypothetical protein
VELKDRHRQVVANGLFLLLLWAICMEAGVVTGSETGDVVALTKSQ